MLEQKEDFEGGGGGGGGWGVVGFVGRVQIQSLKRHHISVR